MCIGLVGPYTSPVPKLWTETIEAHRRTVQEAILDTAWTLVRDRGLMSVTMSEIAEKAGIGRATLYRYFPDVEAILVACHQRHVAAHLGQLAELGSAPGAPMERLEAVLGAYALICHHRARQGTDELSALVHRDEHVDPAQQQLLELFRDLLTEAAAHGGVRDDIAPWELASYCLHALQAASDLPDEGAVRRLVAVTLTALRQHD